MTAAGGVSTRMTAHEWSYDTLGYTQAIHAIDLMLEIGTTSATVE